MEQYTPLTRPLRTLAQAKAEMFRAQLLREMTRWNNLAPKEESK